MAYRGRNFSQGTRGNLSATQCAPQPRRFPAPHDPADKARLIAASSELWRLTLAKGLTLPERAAASAEYREVEGMLAALAKATQPAASRGEATPNSTAELGA
jgi:hypothetical protein